MGLYRLTGQMVNQFPVYKHVENEEYVFVGPNGYWRVGPDTTSWRGSHLKYPAHPTPDKPPSKGWNYWANKWEKDPHIQLTESGDNDFDICIKPSTPTENPQNTYPSYVPSIILYLL